MPWWLRKRIRGIPVFSKLLRWLFARLFQNSQFNHIINAGPAKGLQMPITLPDDKFLWTATWEIEISEHLQQMTRQGSIALDIGAHRGFFAGIMALAGAEKVYCFEPLPENLEKLHALCELNPQLAIDILPVALAEENGTAEFIVDFRYQNAMGKLSSSTFKPKAKNFEKLTVNVRSLDSLNDEQALGDIGLIKIDVEGAEIAVLRGAEAVLSRFKPSLMIEIHSYDLFLECQTFLSDLGYRLNVVETDFEPITESSFKIFHLVAVPV